MTVDSRRDRQILAYRAHLKAYVGYCEGTVLPGVWDYCEGTVWPGVWGLLLEMGCPWPLWVW